MTTRCDLLDLLEEAIILRRDVEIALVDGTTFTGRPLRIAARAGEDWVTFADDRVVGVGQIVNVGKP